MLSEIFRLEKRQQKQRKTDVDKNKSGEEHEEKVNCGY